MEILIISIVTFFAAILTFFSGFGLGTILTPLMMVFFPVEVAVAFTGVIHFSNNIFKLFLVGNYVNKEVFIKFGIPAIIAAFIGSFILFNINSNIVVYSYNLLGNFKEVSLIKFIASLLLIFFALIDLVPFFGNLKFNKKSLPIGGFLSGFFGGLTGNQGALRSAFLIKVGLEKKVFIGTTVFISFFVDLTRLGVYSINLININLSDHYVLGIFAISSGIVGSLIGNKLLTKVTVSGIRILVAILILLLSLGLLLGLL
ncbi:sulfite exporter TauE/SafE family protein [Flavobacteriaceae bacterium]|nr:sulfite exporter TauE/SafE family protein [Flavobacteriaceae bacterium]